MVGEKGWSTGSNRLEPVTIQFNVLNRFDKPVRFVSIFRTNSSVCIKTLLIRFGLY
jgi:hypothetical protein